MDYQMGLRPTSTISPRRQECGSSSPEMQIPRRYTPRNEGIRWNTPLLQTDQSSATFDGGLNRAACRPVVGCLKRRTYPQTVVTGVCGQLLPPSGGASLPFLSSIPDDSIRLSRPRRVRLRFSVFLSQPRRVLLWTFAVARWGVKLTWPCRLTALPREPTHCRPTRSRLSAPRC
jgi:hypothetical protein